MALSATEVSDLIKKKIESFDVGVEARTEGTIVTLTDGIARIHGLSDVMQGEMIEFPGGTYGLALNLERDSVGSVVMGDYGHISEGNTVKCTGRILEVPVGRGLLGRVVNSLGQPIDEGSDLIFSQRSAVAFGADQLLGQDVTHAVTQPFAERPASVSVRTARTSSRSREAPIRK